MSLIVDELRHVVATVRTKPYPISDLIPLLNRSADLIAGHEDLLEKKQAKIDALEDMILELQMGEDL